MKCNYAARVVMAKLRERLVEAYDTALEELKILEDGKIEDWGDCVRALNPPPKYTTEEK